MIDGADDPRDNVLKRASPPRMWRPTSGPHPIRAARRFRLHFVSAKKIGRLGG